MPYLADRLTDESSAPQAEVWFHQRSLTSLLLVLRDFRDFIAGG